MVKMMAATYRAPPERELYLVEVLDRTPTLGDQTLLRHVEVEHVERVVDRLDLPNLQSAVKFSEHKLRKHLSCRKPFFPPNSSKQ